LWEDPPGLAVLKVLASGLPTGDRDSNALKVGQLVIAVGNPRPGVHRLDRRGQFLGRAIRSISGRLIENIISTRPAQSGQLRRPRQHPGPVVGINTAIIAPPRHRVLEFLPNTASWVLSS
jgi:hypothetical protein